MKKLSLDAKKRIGVMLTIIMAFTVLFAMTAYANGNYGQSSSGHNNSNDHDDDDDNDNPKGTVPYPKTETDFKGFRLSSPYTLVSGQPTASGSMSDANTYSTALKDYTESACVPFVVTAKNKSNKTGDVRLTLSYEYEAGLLMGA